MSSDLQEFQKLVSSTQKPVFAMVSATWCNPCKLIKPEFKSKSEVHKDNATFVIIDADESQEICSHYGITSIPTILVFKNGISDVVDQFSGSNIDVFNKFLNKHL